jgi:hypothetical protein
MLSGRYNVALPLDRQSNGFIEIPWDYFFSAFLSRSKLFFFPAIASATEKNLIAHPLFEGRLGFCSVPVNRNRAKGKNTYSLGNPVVLQRGVAQYFLPLKAQATALFSAG